MKRTSSSTGEMEEATIDLIMFLRRLLRPNRVHSRVDVVFYLSRSGEVYSYAQRMHQKLWKYDEQD
jgi:hypothetical protein